MTDHLIPSVEDAAAEWYARAWTVLFWPRVVPRSIRLRSYQQACLHADAASVALDNALAQASDRRRAADDELRRTVAW